MHVTSFSVMSGQKTLLINNHWVFRRDANSGVQLAPVRS
jgi:hypothetical protein